MMQEKMNSWQRTMAALSHQEADRVPIFLTLTIHGAKELDLSIQDYFAKPANVVEGQIRLQKKFGHDCLYSFYYAAAELIAWGGEAIFYDDGPPNAGPPVFKNFAQVRSATAPRVADSPLLQNILETIRQLKVQAKEEIPILGVAISPFSLPPMQLGFDQYLDLIFEERELFWHLMRLNIAFTIEWANAQLEAGATAIAYFDPVASPSLITPKIYQETGRDIARETIAGIKGATAFHFASGRCLDILDDIIASGTAAVAVSCVEDIEVIKEKCRGKITVIGNLNGIEMCTWDREMAEEKVRELIARAAAGGGFIVADNHGEIPLQVRDDVLFTIVEAVKKWGRYPILREQ